MKYFTRNQLKLDTYEIKIIRYAILCIVSEFSKLLILFAIFCIGNHILEFLISLLVLLPLRWFSGGLHLKTYRGCLITTVIFFFITVYIFPRLLPKSFLLNLFVLISTSINFLIAPIPSSKRVGLFKHSLRKYKIYSLVYLIFYNIVIYFLHHKISFIIVGTIIAHTIQLLIAYSIKLRGDDKHE